MRKLNTFEDFLFSNLFEAVKTPLPFKFSDRLRDILIRISDRISEDLLLQEMNGEDREITLIDIDNDDNNKFTYILSNKLHDYLAKRHNYDPEQRSYILTAMRSHMISIDDPMWTTLRTSSRIGSFVQKIFPKKYVEREVEEFVNAVKAKRVEEFERFRIVKGDDILKYYLYENYDDRAEETPLGVSCMRHSKCQEFLKFYTENNLEMVVMMSDEDNDKIMGRALLWKVKTIDGEITDRKYMDRIYTIEDYYIQMFKNFAIKNNWLYKNNQNRMPNEYICDPSDKSCKRRKLITDNNIKRTKTFPYLDTLAYYYWKDGYLSNIESLTSNDNEQPYFLQNIHGQYTIRGMRYVDHYQRHIPEDELVHCEYGEDWRYEEDTVRFNGEYATREWADANLVYSTRMDEWLESDDQHVIYLEYYDDYVTDRYANRYMCHSDYDDEWYDRNDTVYSDYYETYLHEDNVIKVIKNPNNDTDWRILDDDSYISYYNENIDPPKYDYYDVSRFSDKFVKCYYDRDNRMIYKNIEWDADNLIEYKDKWYYKMTMKDIKNYLTENEEN